MAEHTPGPWLVEKREAATDAGTASHGSHGSQTHLIWSTSEIGGNVVAHIVVDGEIGQSEADANARLIAASPQLLEVAKLVEQFLNEDYQDSCEILKRLEQAIFNAEEA